MSFVSLPLPKETEEAAFFYESVSPGLGSAFLGEVEEKYDKLKTNPLSYSFIDNKKILRDVAIRRFPYVIIFKVEPHKVIVISVHHTSKKPAI